MKNLNKNKKIKSVLIVLGLILSIFVLIWIAYKVTQSRFHKPSLSEVIPSQSTDCDHLEVQAFEMKDSFMEDLIKKGEQASVIVRYYECHPVERDDTVLYRYSTQAEPVIRIARGLPGDHFKLIKDKKRKVWNLKINGEFITDKDGSPHFFGADAPPLMMLYQKSYQGVLPPNVFIVLSYQSPGDLDSGSFGIANSFDFVGKVVQK